MPTKPVKPTAQDVLANETVVLGAVFAAINDMPGATVELPTGTLTPGGLLPANALWLRLDYMGYMGSRYRVTVTYDPAPGDPGIYKTPTP